MECLKITVGEDAEKSGRGLFEVTGYTGDICGGTE
jgi:hypothetical protein